MSHIEYLRERVKFLHLGLGKRLRMAAAGIAAVTCACVWWFVLYPELCFPEEAYEIIWFPEENLALVGGEEAEENGEKLPRTSKEQKGCWETSQENEKQESCRELLQADEEQVIVKSRLLEWLSQQKN